ncbi:Outer membrane protein [Gammaproteobacteria bacterium]
MKKIFYLVSVALVCITFQSNAVATSAAAKTEVFDQQQTKQIEQIVHDYLVKNPNVLVEASKKLQEQEAAKEEANIQKIKNIIPKYKKEIFDTNAASRVVTGNPNGKLIIAEFTQYQCGHCKAVAPLVDKLLKDNPEAQLITIYWPFFGNDAIYASKVALAAQKQNKFNELNQAMLATTDFLTKDKIDVVIKATTSLDAKKLLVDIEAKEIDVGLKANFKLAGDLGLIGTPTFIFTNKEMTKFSLVPGQTRDMEGDLKKSLNEVK